MLHSGLSKARQTPLIPSHKPYDITPLYICTAQTNPAITKNANSFTHALSDFFFFFKYSVTVLQPCVTCIKKVLWQVSVWCDMVHY